MQLTEKATKLCPMCNEINHIDVGQVGFVCGRCGYNEGVKQAPKVSAFKESKAPKGLGRKEF
ncbi:hypothetical protein ACFLZ6_02430 [Nanoarchaeota archaeon]